MEMDPWHAKTDNLSVNIIGANLSVFILAITGDHVFKYLPHIRFNRSICNAFLHQNIVYFLFQQQHQRLMDVSVSMI